MYVAITKSIYLGIVDKIFADLSETVPSGQNSCFILFSLFSIMFHYHSHILSKVALFTLISKLLLLFPIKTLNIKFLFSFVNTLSNKGMNLS